MIFAPIPDCVHITGSRLVVRKRFEELTLPRKKNKTAKQAKNEDNLKHKAPSGVVTRKIKAKMVRILETWIKTIAYGAADARGRKKECLTFVTLTLPALQKHTDQELNKALNRYLIKLKRLGAYTYYFWRAERQENGNLHYHLVLDKYIKWELIRKEWNIILEDLGYIADYRRNQEEKHRHGFYFDQEAYQKSGRKWTKEKQLKAYQEGIQSNWSNPNSTDIHGLKKINDVSSYITKYCTKRNDFEKIEDPQERAKALEAARIKARLWGCSDALKPLREVVISEYEMDIDPFIEAVKATAKKVHQDEMVTIIYSREIRSLVKQFPRIRARITQHFRKLYGDLYPSGYKVVNKTLFIVPGKDDFQEFRQKVERTIKQQAIDFEF